MRRHQGMTVAVVALTLLLGVVGLAQAGVSIDRLTAVQYSGGEGLFVALLYVATTDKTIDATLVLPHPDAKGNTELHPIADFSLPNHKVFKFATKGNPVNTAGDVIEALVVDHETPEELDQAVATCNPFGGQFFLCR